MPEEENAEDKEDWNSVFEGLDDAFLNIAPIEWRGKTARLVLSAQLVKQLNLSKESGVLMLGDGKGTVLLIRNKKAYERLRPDIIDANWLRRDLRARLKAAKIDIDI